MSCSRFMLSVMTFSIFFCPLSSSSNLLSSSSSLRNYIGPISAPLLKSVLASSVIVDEKSNCIEFAICGKTFSLDLDEFIFYKTDKNDFGFDGLATDISFNKSDDVQPFKIDFIFNDENIELNAQIKLHNEFDVYELKKEISYDTLDKLNLVIADMPSDKIESVLAQETYLPNYFRNIFDYSQIEAKNESEETFGFGFEPIDPGELIIPDYKFRAPSRFTSKFDNDELIDNYNVNTDRENVSSSGYRLSMSSIVELISSKYFRENCTYYEVGTEWGYFIRTTKIAENGPNEGINSGTIKYRSDVILFDIETKLPGYLSKEEPGEIVTSEAWIYLIPKLNYQYETIVKNNCSDNNWAAITDSKTGYVIFPSTDYPTLRMKNVQTSLLIDDGTTDTKSASYDPKTDKGDFIIETRTNFSGIVKDDENITSDKIKTMFGFLTESVASIVSNFTEGVVSAIIDIAGMVFGNINLIDDLLNPNSEYNKLFSGDKGVKITQDNENYIVSYGANAAEQLKYFNGLVRFASNSIPYQDIESFENCTDPDIKNNGYYPIGYAAKYNSYFGTKYVLTNSSHFETIPMNLMFGVSFDVYISAPPAKEFQIFYNDEPKVEFSFGMGSYQINPEITYGNSSYVLSVGSGQHYIYEYHNYTNGSVTFTLSGSCSTSMILRDIYGSIVASNFSSSPNKSVTVDMSEASYILEIYSNQLAPKLNATLTVDEI